VLRGQLQQLVAKLDTVKEFDSAAVQQVASRALAVVCQEVQLAVQQLQQQATLAASSIQDWQQQQQQRQQQVHSFAQPCS